MTCIYPAGTILVFFEIEPLRRETPQKREGTDCMAQSAIIKQTKLTYKEGDRASFDIEQGQKGPAAANVTLI